ncbi:ATP-binding protein [Vibrio kasasachensis]|uniref:ATP-binding protein n=2 Tax=Vibrio TaxID=662 RepID=UPI003D10D24A
MVRAFSILWVVIFLPIIFLSFSSDYSPVWLFNHYVLKTASIKQESGTFHLIEQTLADTPTEKWPQKIEQLALEFGNELQLLPLPTATKNQSLQQQLQRNKYVFIEGIPNLLLRRVGDSQWVISLAMGMSEKEYIIRAARGSFHLAIKKFESSPREQWPEQLKELSTYFPHDIKLLTKADVALDQDQMAKLNQNEPIWEIRDQIQVVVHALLPDQHTILRVITVPAHNSLNIAMVSLIFIVIVSVCMFVWVYPLWRDLKRLSITADKFGYGYLTERAELAKTSVVARLGLSFNQMADRIEKLIQGQKELTNAIAHDLRTPLYRLRFACEMLHSDDISEKDRQKYQRSINTSIDDLDHLINQTLILSRYNRAMDISHFSEINLASKIAVEIDHYRLEYKSLTVNFDLTPELENRLLFIDSRALLRALNNLLSNAARYAKEQVKIGLYLNNTHCVLTVEDDGPGINEEHWQSVFEPFVQLQNTHRDIANGHGLGLAIVQQIALWHKGEVSIGRSALGGAKFDIGWPLQLR